VLVQHNGVDGERFRIRDRAAERAALGLSQERRLICYVGNLVHEKGVDLLVEAMGLLVRSGRRDLDLALVGAGGLAEPLQKRAAELGITEHLRFVGRRPHEEIARWIAAADAFCLPSRREGCPNVVLEALACGRPVVAARVGGVPELVSPGTGVLVQPESPEALAAGLREALERPWDPQALRDAVPCLSWDQFGRTLYETVKSAHREHHASRHAALAERAAA
jgi:glycosyltransferase involved in cell wall biosynthesis